MDSPQNLLQNPDSKFTALVRETGAENDGKLRAMAQASNAGGLSPAELLAAAKEAVGGQTHEAIKKLLKDLEEDPESPNIKTAIDMAEFQEEQEATGEPPPHSPLP